MSKNQVNGLAKAQTNTVVNDQTNETTKPQDMMTKDQADDVAYVTKTKTHIDNPNENVSVGAENPTDMAIEDKTDTTGKKEMVDVEKLMNGIAEVQSGRIDKKDIAYAAQEQAKEEQEKTDGLWEIRARFKNLAASVLPKQPYLMGIPSKARVSAHEGPDWRRGTPFSPHEERVQYVSFQRLDNDDTLLRPQSWDEENARSSQSGSMRRTSSEMSEQAPRKRLSVEEYVRLKMAGSASGAASREGSIVPTKVEAKFSPKGNTGPSAEPSFLLKGSPISKTDAMAVEGGIIAPKAQGKIPIVPLENGIKVDNNCILKKEATKQKDAGTQKEATAPKEGHTQKGASTEKQPITQKEATQIEATRKETSLQNAPIKRKEATNTQKVATLQTAAISQTVAMTQKEVTAQKLNARQNNVNRENMVAVRNEVASEKEANPTEGEPAYSRKR
jgi:hypothetical protein